MRNGFRHNLCWAAGLTLFAVACGAAQPRAAYENGLVFVGRPEGFTGATYVRLFMAKRPHDPAALPALTFTLNGEDIPLSGFTPDRAASLGGQAPEGAIYDSNKYCIQYRFDGDRLQAFSIIPPRWDGESEVQSAVELSVNDGPRFRLPITKAQLTEHAGDPASSRLHIAN